MSKLLFLPDRNGREKESDGAGLVRLSADTSEMAALTKRMVIRQETDEITPDAAYQGAMALALLLDSWQGTDVRLAVRTIDAQKSRFASWVMAARPMEQRNQPIRLLMLVKDQQEALLGLVDAENGLTLAAQMGDIWDMLPERATWVNREDKCFRSPLPLLNEADCDLLLRRLHRMNLPGDRAKSFRAALNQRLTQEREMLSHSEEETLARLAIRAQAALGMMKVPGFAVLEENSLMDTENPLMQCFTSETVGVSEALKRQQVLLWHGKAFGRSSKVLGWTDTNWPDEAETLGSVEQEIALMADGSVWWNKKLADALNAYLRERSDKALLPAAREYLTLVKGQAEQNARQVQGTVTLQFPWRADSGAVQSLLQEALGDGWQEAAKQPFSQGLPCLTGVQLGDQALRTCCILENATMLPPLSMEMAKTIAENPNALALDAFRYQVEEDGSVTASYLLRARGEVRFVRTYAPDEQLYLENPPMVAVYPCAPMVFWHQYQVLVKGGDAKVCALSDGQWQGVENRENWTALLTAQYPSCLMLEKDGESLGALPNILDKEPDAGGNQPAIASIDLGTAVTAVTLTIGGREIPATHRPLLRMLLTLSDTPMDDMMTSLTMAANLIPTAVVLTGASSSHQHSHVWGNVMIMLCACATALYMVWFKALVARYRITTVLRWVYCVAAVVALPFGLKEIIHTDYAAIAGHALFPTLFVLTVPTYLPNLMLNYALKSVPATVSSIYTYLQPVLAIAISVGMGLDKLHADTVVFALVIFVGVGLVLRSYSVPPRHPDPPAAPPH